MISYFILIMVPYIHGSMVTSEEKLDAAGHGGGVACRCSECQRLKDIEDKWICRLGTFNSPNGLNTRDEIKTRSRVNFSKQNGNI